MAGYKGSSRQGRMLLLAALSVFLAGGCVQSTAPVQMFYTERSGEVEAHLKGSFEEIWDAAGKVLRMRGGSVTAIRGAGRYETVIDRTRITVRLTQMRFSLGEVRIQAWTQADRPQENRMMARQLLDEIILALMGQTA